MAELITSERRARRYCRRAFSIPAGLAVAPFMIITAPIIVPVLLIVDLFTAPRRMPLMRLAAMALAFAVHEWWAVYLYIRRGLLPQGDRFESMRGAMAMWSSSLLAWAERILGATLHWGDLDTVPDGHPLVISRHASNVDALIPAFLFTGLLDRPAHHVLKSDLRWAPSMDLFALPLGNYFVTRGSDTEAELKQLERLATVMQPEGSLVIFPEGTFATPQSRARIRASLQRKGETAAVALTDELEALLPPKPAGVLTLLRACPDTTPMILAHRGLDNVASFAGLWSSVPLKEPVTIRWWETAPPPALPSDQVRWLQDEWRITDRWVQSGSQDLPPERN